MGKQMGRKVIFGPRTRWLIHVPVDLAKRVDKWRNSKGRKLSRASVIAVALERTLNEEEGKTAAKRNENQKDETGETE